MADEEASSAQGSGPRVAEPDEHRRAVEAAAAERIDDAVALCRRAIDAGSTERWPLEMLGYLLQRKGDTRGALAALEEATARGQPTAELLYALGRLCFRTGAFAKAIATFERGLALDPNHPDTHYLKGLAEFHAGRTQQAIRSLSRAAELEPANTVAGYYLAVAHARAGALRSAVACLEQVVAAGGEDAAAHYHLGLAYYALGSMSEAARHFGRSIEIDPHDDRSRRMFVMLGERARGALPGRDAGRARPRSSIVWKVTSLAVGAFVIAGAALSLWLARAAEAGELARLVYRALAVGAATTALLAAIVAAIVWWLVRRPLGALQAAAGRVATGELDVEVPGERLDEIGQLVAAFNRMTRELRRGRHELDEIHHDMERRIAEATRQHRDASEELRQANAKLLEFDRLKSAYIQKVVHDLRSPLSIVLMTLDNVAAGLVGPLSDRQREVLAVAQRRAEAMAELVHDLLDLERLRSGEARPQRVPVAVAGLLTKAIEAVRPRAVHKGVSLEAGALADLGAVEADPAALTSVVDNLVGNAVKYTEAGGLVRVQGRHEGPEVVVTVSDTGIGIPAAEVGLVFEEFFRASNARAVEQEGTGLGLAIVKRIVEAHGGAISLRSEQGAGTTIIVRLPLVAA
ncbi:MAG: tetratricopeptide repeat protein [Deltaproteobacteria bacterium]|nr:tetratricopeptide repeat protein [Deltaproteobacteria bacterium]